MLIPVDCLDGSTTWYAISYWGGYGWGGIREFVYDADRPLFLRRKLVGSGRSEFTIVQVLLTHFSSVKPLYFVYWTYTKLENLLSARIVMG